MLNNMIDKRHSIQAVSAFGDRNQKKVKAKLRHNLDLTNELDKITNSNIIK